MLCYIQCVYRTITVAIVHSMYSQSVRKPAFMFIVLLKFPNRIFTAFLIGF